MEWLIVIDVRDEVIVLIRILMKIRLVSVYMIEKIWVGIEWGDWFLYLLKEIKKNYFCK